MDTSSSSVPFSPIENFTRKRSRFSNQTHLTSKETFPTRAKDCEEEKNENENNNERLIENIRLIMMSSNSSIHSCITLKTATGSEISDTEPSEFQSFSDLPSIEIPPFFTKDLDDQRDDSFLTEETFSESDSEADETDSLFCITTGDEADSCVCVNSTDDEEEDSCSQSQYSSASSSVYSKPSVHFADEVGLPIQSIRHYECDRKQREYSELLVLCICPEKKSFEFLQIGYHRNEERGESVKDLLSGIPDMCTNPVFASANFSALYRNNGADKDFQNLCSPPAKQTSPVHKETTNSSSSKSERSYDECYLQLQDCGFRENEMIVASIHGSSERAVLAAIGPLLSNEKIQKTLKKARRSRRGLKFIRREDGDDKCNSYHRRKSRNLSLRRRKTKKEHKRSDEKGDGTVPNLDVNSGELVDDYCHDYDPLYDVAEDYQQLLYGILAVCSGTVVFSALGI